MYGIDNLNRPPRTDLTPREKEVLCFVLAGKPNKLTAYSLGISQRTVEVHRSRIFQKMGVRNAIELVTAVYSARMSGSAHTLAEPASLNEEPGAAPSSQPHRSRMEDGL